MKKLILGLLIFSSFIFALTNIAYADEQMVLDGGSNQKSWVQKAFDATKNFLEGNGEEPATGAVAEIGNSLLTEFNRIIKSINRVLIVLLFGISTISLSVTGIRYIFAADNPNKKEAAKHNLHTAFIGMAYGFGAFTIWSIAMQIIKIIIGALGTGTK